jgi:hypothetical protein
MGLIVMLYVSIRNLSGAQMQNVLDTINSINYDVHQGIEIVSTDVIHQGTISYHLLLKLTLLLVEIVTHDLPESDLLRRYVVAAHNGVRPLKS